MDIWRLLLLAVAGPEEPLNEALLLAIDGLKEPLGELAQLRRRRLRLLLQAPVLLL